MFDKGKKVYLVVYACEPNQGGEHEVGWKTAYELSDKCNLTVITRKANQKLIEKHNKKNIKFIYIENEKFLFLKPKGKFSYLYYLFWQFSVYLYLHKIVMREDIIHYLTFGNIHLPHFLYLINSKLVIGPLGGGSIVDTKLIKNASFKTKLKSKLHKIINTTVKINPIYYLVFRRSSKIILRTKETLELVPKKFYCKCSVFLETGIDTSKINLVSKERKLYKIVTTSRIIESKNIDQVIEVFKMLQKMTNVSLELIVAGDGDKKAELEKKYSLISNLKFIGKVPHEQIEILLQEADLFIFCSIKEGGSHSLFEAAMNNCPIACYDISGMQEFPKNNASIKVKPTYDIENNIKLLAEKIINSFKEKKIEQICQNAIIDLQKNYDWQKICEKYLKIYDEISKKENK